MIAHKESKHCPIELLDVSFAYPAGDEVSDGELAADGGAEVDPISVFSGLTLRLPSGLTFMVGPNGIGKSTLMLLAAARLFPTRGEIRIHGESTLRFADAALEPEMEDHRNRLVSFVYQNMEFETELPVGDVLEMVARNSVDESAAADRFREIVTAVELTERLTTRMQELSKGEMQRGIIAMSLLYGSPIVMMDEPVFAVEPHRSEALFEYLRAACRERGLAVYTSVHDVRLAQQFADEVVLMHADGLIETGDPAVLLARDRLEQAFKAPWDTLYRRQSLYRDLLNRGIEEAPES